MVNVCGNLEAAIRCASSGSTVSATEGIALCNDADQVLDCLRLELRQRGDQVSVLGLISNRLAKVKAQYLAQVIIELHCIMFLHAEPVTLRRSTLRLSN